MGINVVYQGILVEKTGKATENFPETGSSKNVVKEIIRKHPSIKHLNFVIAINGVISHEDVVINDGDSVTLIPPAPGG